MNAPRPPRRPKATHPSQKGARWFDCSGAAGARTLLVVSGHVHQYRIPDTGARREVWGPTTWAVLSDRIQGPFGNKRCGVVALTLTADGQAEPA
jgi:hypothetical protein